MHKFNLQSPMTCESHTIPKHFHIPYQARPTIPINGEKGRQSLFCFCFCFVNETWDYESCPAYTIRKHRKQQIRSIKICSYLHIALRPYWIVTLVTHGLIFLVLDVGSMGCCPLHSFIETGSRFKNLIIALIV